MRGTGTSLNAIYGTGGKMKFLTEKTQLGYTRIVFRAQSHWHVKYNVYLHESFLPKIDSSGYFSFPVEKAVLMKEYGHNNYVLRPDSEYNVFYVSIASGYRGSASFSSIENGEVVIKDISFHSGQGRLGETVFALVNTKKDCIIVKGSRTGRRIDNKMVDLVFKIDGTIVDSEESALGDLLKL